MISIHKEHKAGVRTFEYFDGVAKETIPDNTKTVVIKPDEIY
jgi:transposase